MDLFKAIAKELNQPRKDFTLAILKTRKENPQKLTQLGSRFHPRHL